MKRLMLVLVSVALGGGAAAPTGGQEMNDDMAVVVSGPALGGDRVFWGESTWDTMFVLLRSPMAAPRVVYRKGSTPSRENWFADGIVASPSVVAFQRGWIDCTVPRREPRGSRAHGRFRVRKGLLPHEEETEEVGICGGGGGDAMVGKPRGPFRPLSRKAYCPDESGISVDVDGAAIAFAETFCRRGVARERIAVRQSAGGRDTQLENTVSGNECCGGVRMAGRFVAWRDNGSIVVYDLSLGRVAYRARVWRKAWVEFDVQRNGKLVAAIVKRYVGDRPLPARLVLFSSEQRTGRLFSSRALFTGVRLVDDHVLFERALGRNSSELVVADLAGRARRVDRFRKGNRRWADFDFDGDTIAWASRQDRVIRRECGGRICYTVADGVITIWKAEIGHRALSRERVAARPFRGLRPAG